jgi:predicted metal-dependent phosphoesterase TrpH
MIDLHSHTTASDGQYTPSELIARAARAGITHLAVTDHDTVAGLLEASEAAKPLGLVLIHGIEISAFLNEREVHILGHFVRSEDPRLRDFAIDAGEQRRQRMKKMVAKMNEMGFPVTLEQVGRLAGSAQLGRPHLARVLVDNGICSSVKEAFDRFLADGRPAFVARDRLGYAEAIRMIRESEGVATLAHPVSSRVNSEEIRILRDSGLGGLEVFRPDHPPSVQSSHLELARKLDLVPTAGSDFHGEKVVPDRHLGSVSMEMATFQALQARAIPSPSGRGSG